MKEDGHARTYYCPIPVKDGNMDKPSHRGQSGQQSLPGTKGRILSGKGAEGAFYDAKNVLYLNLGSNFMNTFVKIHWAVH